MSFQFVQLVFGLALIATGIQCQTQFRVIKEWRYVNYTWPSEDALRLAMATGQYHPEKCVMTGLAYYRGYYYLATPRMYDGTPVTLSRVSETGDTAPALEPFPSWQKNHLGDCDALQNVHNIQIDADGMMYVIDSGRIHRLLPGNANFCPPKLVKFDLNQRSGEELAKQVIKYEFPEHVVNLKGNYLYDLVLDHDFIYISDNSAQDPGIVVFSKADVRSWKIRHGTFKADNNATTIAASGEIIVTPMNLAGLALGPPTDGGRLLYYSPLSSFQIFAVNTSELQNPRTHSLKNVQSVGIKESQTDGMTADSNGVLYYGLIGTSSIVRWDTATPFRPKLIARDTKYVQWPNSFTFNDENEIAVLTSTFAKFIQRTVNLNDVNFRLLTGNVNASSYVKSLMDVNDGTPKMANTTAGGEVSDVPLSDSTDDKPAMKSNAIITSVNLMSTFLMSTCIIIVW